MNRAKIVVQQVAQVWSSKLLERFSPVLLFLTSNAQGRKLRGAGDVEVSGVRAKTPAGKVANDALVETISSTESK